MYAGDGRTVVGIWNVTELATEGRSLEKLGALLERLESMSPASEEVRRCIMGEVAMVDCVPSTLVRLSLNMGKI